MGLFSRKKKTSPPLNRSNSSPTPSVSTIVPTPPESPCLHHSVPFFKPQITLRVALDPAPENEDEGIFYIMLDHDAELGAIREAIGEQIGTTAVSLFKVSIPLLAYRQAGEYRRRYSTPVNLLTNFPSFNLDDPRQLPRSFGSAWSGTGRRPSQTPRLNDWFPETPLNEVISVLVRTSESSTSAIPLTFISHFAPSELPLASPRPPFGSKISYRPSTVVSLDTKTSVRQLKSAILRADGRKVVENQLERVVLWRVEMSEEEMNIIGERGGLKNGRMPWPYPPGAPVPTALSDDTLPIDHYFAHATSNAHMVTLSVWLDGRANAEMPRPTSTTANTPSFRFPMDFSEPKPELASNPRKSRQRPSTAPAVVVTTSGQTSSALHTFGAPRALSTRTSRTPDLTTPANRPRATSPLSTSSIPVARGLGINVSGSSTPIIPQPQHKRPSFSRAQTMPRGSISASDCSSTDDESVPRLSFSQLSLSTDPSSDGDLAGPLTPDIMDKEYDWLASSAGGEGGSKNVPSAKVRFADLTLQRLRF